MWFSGSVHQSIIVNIVLLIFLLIVSSFLKVEELKSNTVKLGKTAETGLNWNFQKSCLKINFVLNSGKKMGVTELFHFLSFVSPFPVFIAHSHPVTPSQCSSSSSSPSLQHRPCCCVLTLCCVVYLCFPSITCTNTVS